MLKKEEPPTVTLVLMNAQVLLVIDWLNGAKDFILQNTGFSAPGTFYEGKLQTKRANFRGEARGEMALC